MKVAILGNRFITWGGGIDLLKNYINALSTQDCEIVLLIPNRNTSFQGLVKDVKRSAKNVIKRILHVGIIDRIDYEELVVNFTNEFPNLDYILFDVNRLYQTCTENNIDIIFPCHECVDVQDIPWIGYVFDFQHRYLTEFFTDDVRKDRDLFFDRMLSTPEAIVTNSQDTRNDCLRFYPNTRSRIYVTPFAPIPRDEWLNDNYEMIKKYNIDSPYIIICNQLWQHKGHLCAIDGLKKLIGVPEYSNYILVCTGALEDGRNPQYVNKVKERIHSLQLDDKVLLLGYLPKLEQVELIKHAEFVVQPTMFEGGPGGGAAYDAISLGKQIILSDINVNKEVDSELALFFSSEDSDDLLQKMIYALNHPPHKKTKEELLKQGNRYKLRLGEYIFNMLNNEIQLQKEK